MDSLAVRYAAELARSGIETLIVVPGDRAEFLRRIALGDVRTPRSPGETLAAFGGDAASHGALRPQIPNAAIGAAVLDGRVSPGQRRERYLHEVCEVAADQAGRVQKRTDNGLHRC